MKKLFAILFIVLAFTSFSSAQVVERVYSDKIGTPQLYQYGDQQSFPVMTLNSDSRLQLEFDDFEGGVKNYYYTYVLCDYNWKPVNISTLEYIKGFTQNRITTYRYSNYALTKYTHYQAILPERGSVPTKPGNYLLKVFLDGDTSQTAFTRQMVVLDVKSAVLGNVVQPAMAQYFTTHQRLNFSVLMNDNNAFSMAQQVRAVIIQNNRWDNAIRDIKPTFVRGRSLEFNMENTLMFPAGKEWRWLDLRSFRLLSDRVDSAAVNDNRTDLFLKIDGDRSGQRYVYFPDLDGSYRITTYETINPLWQADYATVHFKFDPGSRKPLAGKKLFLIGGFTDFLKSEKWEMKFDETTGLYTADAFLKQGYYNYSYEAVDEAGRVQEFEGNYWETENTYTILVYYKSFTDRWDQLIGVGRVLSRTDRPGLIF